MTQTTLERPRFAIFRGRDATDFEKSGLMSTVMPTQTEIEGSVAAVEAGMMEGTTVRLLFAMPGLSLTHAWFKSGFPLPRHSHNVDCLYFILAGSLRLGVETLGAGDGFFVGADVPYAYVPGEDGVEVLEFRGSNSFDIRLLANNPAYWAKAVESVTAKRGDWPEETPPSGLPIG
jgi:mannose-6-phosphate isomerase-like protein (cupin superfamily)